MEDSSDFEHIKTDYLMYKIMYSALEKMIETNSFESGLKEKLLYLINPISKENLTELELDSTYNLGLSNSDHSVEKKPFNLLGLSPDIVSELNTPSFTPQELSLIQKIYLKELSEYLKELSENRIELAATALPDTSKDGQTFEESLELAKDINELVLDNNSESANIVHLQNDLIKLKYKTIPTNELKRVEEYEKQKLQETLKLASDLYEETLNIIYPSEDCKIKMEEEVRALKEELKEINKSIEELSQKKEMYQKAGKELMDIVKEYKEIKKKKMMIKMTLEEIKKQKLP
ncbi:hypothetical protein O3M35_006197 [Rhynocoris fuscipes]|uniref:Uncharacterized protein n=1 Tax=Rhynocoris fuscipes TaxID=488301 RepID=A0AAW1DG63_9HEMI